MSEQIEFWLVKYDSGEYHLRYRWNPTPVRIFDCYPTEEQVEAAIAMHTRMNIGKGAMHS